MPQENRSRQFEVVKARFVKKNLLMTIWGGWGLSNRPCWLLPFELHKNIDDGHVRRLGCKLLNKRDTVHLRWLGSDRVLYIKKLEDVHLGRLEFHLGRPI